MPPIVKEVLRSPGESLDARSLSLGRSLLRTNFSDVRLHSGPRASDSTRAVDAVAYTVGNHIVFNDGRDAIPSGDSGLLLHELTHVAQQRGVAANKEIPVRPLDHPSEEEADAARERMASGLYPTLHPAPFGLYRAGDPSKRAKPPAVIPSGRRIIIQWGDDKSTVANVKALQTGARTGPNAAGTGNVVHYRELTEDSLAEMREVVVVLHGESDVTGELDVFGRRVRVIEPGETFPRAQYGAVGLPKGETGPAVFISPEELADQLVRAGFGGGRWTRYRVRLLVCYSGIGGVNSYSSRVSKALAERGVTNETIGFRGAVTATGRYVPKEKDFFPPTAYSPDVDPSRKRIQLAGNPKGLVPREAGHPQAANEYWPYDTHVGPPGTRLRRDRTRALPAGTKTPSAPAPGSPTLPEPIPVKTAEEAPKTPSKIPASPGKSSAASAVEEEVVEKKAPSSRQSSTSTSSPHESDRGSPADVARRAEAIGGGAILALEAVNSLLNQIGDDIQRKLAAADYEKQRPAMREALRKNPGIGIIVTFHFFQVTPHPDSVIRPGDEYQYLDWRLASSPNEPAPPSAGALPNLKQGTYSTSSQTKWIAPLKPAEAAQLVPDKAVEISTPEAWLAYANPQFGNSYLKPYEVLKAAKSMFPSYQVVVGSHRLDVAGQLYTLLISFYASKLKERLTKRSADLKNTIDSYQAKLEGLMKEDWVMRHLKGRGDPLTGHELDAARFQHSIALWPLEHDQFREAWDALQRGEDAAEQARRAMVVFETGEPLPED